MINIMNDSKPTHSTKENRYRNLSESLLFRGVVRGMLPMYLLLLLKDRPYHGTELMKVIADMSHGGWKPSPGSVYPMLKKLEQEGLISGTWKSGRAAATRVYRVTEKGRSELGDIQQQLLSELRQVGDTIRQHIVVLEQMLTAKGK